LVVGDRQYRAADDLELAALDRQFVEKYRSDDDPGDGPQAVGKAIAGSGQCHVHRHLEGKDRHQDRQRQRDAAGDVAFKAKHGQSQEEKYDWNNGGQCGQAEAAERAVELLPGLHMGWPLIVVG